MAKAVTVLLIIVGLINFVPVLGVLGAQKLESAYSVSLGSSDLIILMRHRALLFGILGGFILFAAFCPGYQTVAMSMAGISMVGFAVLTHLAGEHNAALHKVLIVDYVGIACLAAAALIKFAWRNGASISG